MMLATGFTPNALTAQNSAEGPETKDTGGLLVSFLEDTLSGDSRRISVTGLTGALSSRAQIEQLSIADDQGVWLIIKGAELDWNRLALIQGRFSVNSLSAEAITLLRSPSPTASDPELPSPEAPPFRLPELPVAVELGEIRANRVDLGADLLGQAASLSVNGSLSLADGALQTRLEALRLDRPGDKLSLIAGYANQSRQIDLDLTLTEASGGLLSTVLDLPGRPSLAFQAKGNGPVEDFAADIALLSNDEQRLAGQVALAGTAPPAPSSADLPLPPGGIAFRADLNGDIDPLLPSAYRPFFGPDLSLALRGEREGNGRLTLDSLVFNTEALRLTGMLSTLPDGSLETANLKADVMPAPGTGAILLPVPGATTTLGQAQVTARKRASGDWSLEGTLSRLGHAQFRLEQARLSGSGTLGSQTDAAPKSGLKGNLEIALTGFEPVDPGLATATGSALSLTTGIDTTGPQALVLEGLAVTGADFSATGDLSLSDLGSDTKVRVKLNSRAEDLSRFSDLAKRRLGGAAEARIDAEVSPLSGAFDLDLDLAGTELSAGLPQLDSYTKGRTDLRLRAGRDETGLRIDRLELAAPLIEAEAGGRMDSTSGHLSLNARIRELERLVPEAPGELKLSAELTRRDDTLSGRASAKGPHSSEAKVEGEFTLDGNGSITFETALNDLQRFVPELAGALRATGTAKRRDGQWQLTASATAPADANATVTGSYSETRQEVDLKATGQLRLEGANPFVKPNLLRGAARFDLAMSGTPALRNLTGTVSTANATLALPAAGQRVEDINATVSLRNEGAQLQLSARPGQSGELRVSGPVALIAPYDADLAITMTDLTMSDHLSYDTLINGQLNLSGALAARSLLAGRIDVGETNINLNTVGGSVTAAPIPVIRHTGATPAVLATRARAGLSIPDSQSGSGSRASVTALDVVIDAPGKIFARGRGLRAELGGQLRLQGSSAALAPSGQIGLIRGSFDILGRRLTLDEGQVRLLGNLTPYLEFRSTAQTEQGTATLEISGPSDAPQIHVTSDPPRPSEEALALLLFGDNIKDLSPLALARLATSALTLSGRGGKTQDAIRKGTGADDADIGLDGLDSGRLGLGGYLSENVYTDVDVNTQGQSELSINLDLTDSLSVTGKVDSEGETGMGLLFKRDY